MNRRYYILFNPYSRNGHGAEIAHKLDRILTDGSLEYRDMTRLGSYSEFFSSLSENDKVIVCGGDGTLNRFINDTAELARPKDILYFATGTGNDFLNDIGAQNDNCPIEISEYINGLPVISVNGKRYHFVNGIGYGLDGYSCEECNRIKEKTKKAANYALVAVKGLAYSFRPASATVTVDGETRFFPSVWMVSTMKGKFFGGGIMIAPEQNRSCDDSHISVIIVKNVGKLKTLLRFPTIFKGKHTKFTDMVEVLTGHEISVELDRPSALQMDGDTISGVTSYKVSASKIESPSVQTV